MDKKNVLEKINSLFALRLEYEINLVLRGAGEQVILQNFEMLKNELQNEMVKTEIDLEDFQDLISAMDECARILFSDINSYKLILSDIVEWMA